MDFADESYINNDHWWDGVDSSRRRPPFRGNDFNRPRYAEAYGDYRGGYGRGGGYGPPSSWGPPPLLPPGPSMGCPSMRGRGYGLGPYPLTGGPYRKNHGDQAVKYLMKCGVAKEHLKNLPRDLLQLFQPDYCGLCDFPCDSYTQSRLHYISKNHLKNQKKWLSKSHTSFSANEEPFKSRDLYCELCDIQITSKQHGDLHYQGKPHRGVVEGRKKPKNPLLLQPHMQQRLQQLIRREKRCLKSLKDSVAGEDDKAAQKDAKTGPPELYCEICKTTVTCSEQMTTHLNGKKHLSKEKQHILKMMRGEISDANQNEAGQDEGENNESYNEGGNGEDQTGDNGNVQHDTADDDQEWGNEAWEETEQPENN